jgi:hypothetical protein
MFIFFKKLIKMDTIVQSEYIITPYYNHIIKNTNQPFWYEYQSKNYTPYQFFVLKTRLTPYIKKYQNIGFDSFRYEGQMRYFVNIANAETIIPLTSEQSHHYQQIVNNIISYYPNHCTLLYINQTFVTNECHKSLPQSFVQSVLPYCYHYIIDQEYEPLLYDDQLLININDKTLNDKKYNDVYDDLQNKMLNYLYHLYEYGVILLNDIDDQQFINDWQLQPLYLGDEDNQLYKTTWTSPYVYHVTQFLKDQYEQNDVVIDIQEELLNGYDYHTINNIIFVKFNNYDELYNL